MTRKYTCAFRTIVGIPYSECTLYGGLSESKLQHLIKCTNMLNNQLIVLNIVNIE